jgi:hypothetical protein
VQYRPRAISSCGPPRVFRKEPAIARKHSEPTCQELHSVHVAQNDMARDRRGRPGGSGHDGGGLLLATGVRAAGSSGQ